MSPADAADALVLLTQARSQLDALLMRVLQQASIVEVGADTGASRGELVVRAPRGPRARRRTGRPRLAAALERHEDVAAALAAGDLRTDQARVIVDAVDALPDEVEAWVPVEATRFLLERAVEHDAKALRILGRRVLEVVDPAAADAEEARRLEAEEADAVATASFTMVDDGHGTSHGRFTIPTLHAAMLRKHLMASAFPSRFSRETSAADQAPTDKGGDEAPDGAGVHATTSSPGQPIRCPRQVGCRRRWW